jgi:diguanylate cyclase (GGDEF)-like protein
MGQADHGDHGGHGDHGDLGSVARPGALRLLVALCVLPAAVVLAAAVAAAGPAELLRLAVTPSVTVVVLLAVLAEFSPWLLGRGPDGRVTTVAVFAFAVLLHVGLAAAVILQLTLTVLAGAVRRHGWWRTAFNAGQQTVGIAAAHLVLALAGQDASATDPRVPVGPGVPAVALAGLAYFAVTHFLVWRALAYWQGVTLARVVRLEFGYRAVLAGALLGLAPVMVVVTAHQPWLVPLFALPLLAVHQNAADRRQRQARSLHDDLTGLPNRALLAQRAATALAEAAGRRDGHVALLLLDLDRFKEVNDTLGHATGDRLLQLFASRLEAALRPGDTVARLGGDEFGVLLPAVPGPAAAREIAARVGRACAEPFQLGGLTFDLEASVGLALYPEHGADFETLLRRADVAMYVAKSSHGGVETYEVERDRNTPDRLALFGELRRAIEAGDVELHYQPKVCFDGGHAVGFEALLRWRHATRGVVGPDDFVGLAEQSALMSRLTAHVVDSALAQAARWWRRGLTVPVAVNVSLRDLRSPDFVGLVSAGLRRHGVPPAALQLEITERVLLCEQQRATETLSRLDRIGVRLSLDDFGTGYSSLVHLRRLPVSEIKIDRSFVARLPEHVEDEAIVRSTVELAHSLGIQVVAEGVEDDETWERLGELGCDAAQGWLIAPAMAADQATSWLERNPPAPPPVRRAGT